jgi:hypothetical protein
MARPQCVSHTPCGTIKHVSMLLPMHQCNPSLLQTLANCRVCEATSQNPPCISRNAFLQTLNPSTLIIGLSCTCSFIFCQTNTHICTYTFQFILIPLHSTVLNIHPPKNSNFTVSLHHLTPLDHHEHPN